MSSSSPPNHSSTPLSTSSRTLSLPSPSTGTNANHTTSTTSTTTLFTSSAPVLAPKKPVAPSSLNKSPVSNHPSRFSACSPNNMNCSSYAASPNSSYDTSYAHSTLTTSPTSGPASTTRSGSVSTTFGKPLLRSPPSAYPLPPSLTRRYRHLFSPRNRTICLQSRLLLSPTESSPTCLGPRRGALLSTRAVQGSQPQQTKHFVGCLTTP